MKIVITLAAIVLCLGVYGFIIEPFFLQIREVKISDPILAKAWGDVRLLHLSDLHISKYGPREARLQQLVHELQPDLIVITGDITQWGTEPGPALGLVSHFKAPLGVYGVLGDSDQSANRQRCQFCHVGDTMEQRRIHPYILQNEVIRIPLAQGTMLLGGLIPTEWEDTISGLKLADDDMEPMLVLSHFSRPFSRDWKKRPALCLSGDTHGGQIRLPAFVWQWLSSKSDPKHMAGLYNLGESIWLYVNRGVGVTARFPFRLGVRPEVTLITFKIPAGK